jgi:hypothetical protein
VIRRWISARLVVASETFTQNSSNIFLFLVLYRYFVSIESPSEPAETERQQPTRWERFRQWLGFTAVENQQTSQRGESELVSNGNGAKPSKAQIALNLVDEARAAQTPAGYPEALELGPQRYTNPKFFRPENGGIPLAQDKNYQDALKLLDKLPPADVSAKRYP